MRIPPDPISIRNHILRAHYQLYVWTRCLQQNIEHINLENNGWIILDGIAEPFWFKKELQMPPVVSGSNQRLVMKCWNSMNLKVLMKKRTTNG